MPPAAEHDNTWLDWLVGHPEVPFASSSDMPCESFRAGDMGGESRY